MSAIDATYYGLGFFCVCAGVAMILLVLGMFKH